MAKKHQLRALLKKFRATKFRSIEIEDEGILIRATKKAGSPVVKCNAPVLRSAKSAGADVNDNALTVKKPSIASVGMEAMFEAQVVTPHTINSQRVGHFYFTDPKKLPNAVLVEGATIEKGDILGFIEAMNVKYEVKSDMSGVVSTTLIEDGEAIEYGQPLARLDETKVSQVKE